MLTRTSSLKRTAELRTKVPMKRRRESRNPGLGVQVERIMGFYRPLGEKAPTCLRSEQHRGNVASLPCVICGRTGTQAAHANYGKGMALKQCDSLTFPLCPEHHRAHDQGGMPRDERRRLEWQFADWTRAELLKRNLWPRSVEAHYQRAIQGLRRVSE